MAHASIDFSTFILSLASSAMMHMGLVPDPGGRSAEVNLEMAHQTIEMLAMLRQKTAGNLDQQEAALLERVLHDIRMAYVEQNRKMSS
ncbi:MAG: DUF1844 domain-containing protein [Myxococcota bacterium]